MQTLGLAVTAAPREAARAVATARPHVASALHEHDPENGDDEDDDDDTVRGWQTAYYALLLVEKAAARCPEALTSDASSLSAGADDDDRIASDAVTGPTGRFDAPDAVWAGAQALLLHRHQWVQHARHESSGGGSRRRDTRWRRRSRRAAEDGPLRLERVARSCVAVLEQGTSARRRRGWTPGSRNRR